MDGQLAFFPVRPAKAMGRKGQSPALLLQPGTQTPIRPRGQKWPCLPNFCSQEMWRCRVISLGSVSRGVLMAGILRGYSREELLCVWTHRAGGKGRAQPMGVLVCHFPGLVWSQVWSHTASPKPPFKLGVTREETKPLGLLKRHIWGSLMCPHPQGHHSCQRWQWGDPALPALLSQPAAGMEHWFLPRMVPVEGWTLHGAAHRQGWGLCLGLPLKLWRAQGFLGLWRVWECREPRIWHYLVAAGASGTGVRVSATQPTQSGVPSCSGLKPAQPSVQRDKSPLPLAFPSAPCPSLDGLISTLLRQTRG